MRVSTHTRQLRQSAPGTSKPTRARHERYEKLDDNLPLVSNAWPPNIIDKVLAGLASDRVQNHNFVVRVQANSRNSIYDGIVAVVPRDDLALGVIGDPTRAVYFARTDTLRTVRQRLDEWIDA